MSALLALLLATSTGSAFEGMWMPEQVPTLEARLKAIGMELDPQVLADPFGAPLGAVAGLGFCTASFVTGDGLLLTNHHCAEGFLQYASTEQDDYARDGFRAAAPANEVAAGPGARIWIVERIDDVTGRVMSGVNPRTADRARFDRIEKNGNALVAACERQAHHRCHVASFYGGAEYRLVTQRELRDIRLVYAPPLSVGSYGGEIDNWMWPRHAGDFAVLRAYVAPDGSSAGYSPENVPYRPKKTLDLGEGGVREGDMVMVAGFPGGTERHLLAVEAAFEAEQQLPREISLLGEAIALLEARSASEPASRPKLQAPIGWLGNSLKDSQGTLDGFRRSQVVERKRQGDDELRKWLAADEKNRRSGLAAFDELEALIATEQKTAERDALIGRLLQWSDLMWVAWKGVRQANEDLKPDAERDAGYQDRDRVRTLDASDELTQTLVLGADRDLLRLVLMHAAHLPADQRILPVDALLAQQGGIEGALDHMYGQTTLVDRQARRRILTLSAKGISSEEDPFVAFARELNDWHAPIRDDEKVRSGAKSRLRADVLKSRLAWQAANAPDAPVYPDANNTLRLSFGVVQGYSPADAVTYEAFSSLTGMVAKTGPAPFDAPANLVTAARQAPEPRLMDPLLNDVPVNFLSTLDITGGNSGSPVLDRTGNLVGLAFDGNYESIASDWLFDQNLTRCIAVDIRYVLWLLENDGARWVADALRTG
jgi:Peptidase S46